MPTVQQKVTNAFADLRKKGYFAKQSHTCCNTCGWYEIPDEFKETGKVVFYHRQETESFKKSGKCYLNWAGDSKEISDVLTAHGLHVNWNGSPTTKMIVSDKPSF